MSLAALCTCGQGYANQCPDSCPYSEGYVTRMFEEMKKESSKQETVVYIRVPASQVPENENVVLDLDGNQYYYKHGVWYINDYTNTLGYRWVESDPPEFWLQETPLSSLLQEGAVELEAWMSENCFVTECHKYKHSKDMKTRSLSEIIKLFIEEKYGK